MIKKIFGVILSAVLFNAVLEIVEPPGSMTVSRAGHMNKDIRFSVGPIVKNTMVKIGIPNAFVAPPVYKE